MEEARIRDDCVTDVVKRALTPVVSDAIDRFSVFLFDGEGSKRRDPKLEMVYLLAIELGKPNKLSNIAYYFWFWPCLKQLMLKLSGPVSIGADVVHNKFIASRENMALFQAQGQAIR
jgi:hypothetical protein